MPWFPRITRRRFLAAAGGAVCSAAATGFYACRIEPHWVRVEQRALPIADLPSELVGRRLVQLSDLHVGPLVDSNYLIECFERVAALQPDLIAITGDFLTVPWSDQHAEVTRVLKHLPPVPLGTFAVLGNHDYGNDWCEVPCADSLTLRLTDLGIRVLRNECATVAGLQIVGLDDFWSPRFNAVRTLEQVDLARPMLTLCHNPDGVDRPKMAALSGWVLSGHTHGGQVKPPFLPPPVLPVRNKRYTAGAFELDNRRSLYINVGLGYVRKIRFNMRPEITVFQLERAASA